MSFLVNIKILALSKKTGCVVSTFHSGNLQWNLPVKLKAVAGIVVKIIERIEAVQSLNV